MARPVRQTFRTLNNMQDPATLRDDEMSVAQNVDTRNDSSISLRKGRTLALAGAQHSFWATPDEAFAFFCEASTLKRFWADETATTLLSLSTNDPISFVKVNNLVVFSNGTDIGYIQDGVAGTFTDPTDEFKLPLVAGRFLGFYNSRLFILNNDGLYYTDPYTIDQMDERNFLFPLLGKATMLAPVDGGIWVGKGDKTIWLGGENPEEFSYKDYSDQVVLGTSVVVEDSITNGFKTSGKYALWTSVNGICLGTSGGGLQVLTEGRLAVKPAESGTGILRKQDGLTHYVSVLQDVGTEQNKFEPAVISVDSQTTGG